MRRKSRPTRPLDKALCSGDAMGGGFQAEPNLPMVDPWPTSQKLKNERDLLGFYVSGHPLETFAAEARAFSSATLGDIEGISKSVEQAAAHSGDGGFGYRQQGPVHRFCGIITEIQHRTTRSGKPIVFASIEDFTGQGEIICFSSEYDRYQQYLKQDEIIFVKGNTDIRGGGVQNQGGRSHADVEGPRADQGHCTEG